MQRGVVATIREVISIVIVSNVGETRLAARATTINSGEMIDVILSEEGSFDSVGRSKKSGFVTVWMTSQFRPSPLPPFRSALPRLEKWFGLVVLTVLLLLLQTN
jgi:hypothetical protein